MMTTKILWMAAYTVLLCSCYHLGTPAKVLPVQVGIVENNTAEPNLGTLLKKSLQEHLGFVPGNAGNLGKARYSLDAVVTHIKNSSLARAEIRDKKTRDKDSDAYQTVLYSIEVTVQYRYQPIDGKPEQLRTGSVKGRGDLPRMHDRNVALQNACRQALDDAARQIVDGISDQQ